MDDTRKTETLDANIENDNDDYADIGINWNSFKDLVKQNILKKRKITRYEEPYIFKFSEHREMNLDHLTFGQEYIYFKDMLNNLNEQNCGNDINAAKKAYTLSFENQKRLTHETLEDIFSKTHVIDGKDVPKTLDKKYLWEELFFLSKLSSTDDLRDLYGMIYSSVKKSTISSIKRTVGKNRSTSAEEALIFHINPKPTISRIILRNHFHEISDEALKKILLKREQILERVILYGLTESPKSYVSSVFTHFQNAYSNKLSAYGLDEKEISRRMQYTNVILTDPLLNQMNNNKGMFTEWDNNIYVRVSPKTEELKSITIHEILHQLSGQTILEYKKIVESPNESHYEFLVQRIGTRLSNFKYYYNESTKESYRWLNEAITEDIAQEISPSSVVSYPDERELYSLLLTSGKRHLSKELFARAYFEDFNPNDKERIPCWKDMWRSVQESYDKTFLQRLDAVVRDNGVEYAIHLMKKDINKI